MRRAFLLLACALGGCGAVGPNYTPPQIPMPEGYGPQDAPLSMPVEEGADLSAWWSGFQDRELDSLIRRALAQNLDLKTAESRVRAARAQEIIAGAKGLPQLNATGNAARLHSGSDILQKIGGGAPASGGSPAADSGGTDISLYSAGFDATWELDVFGGVRRGVEAAAAGTEAARWQMRDGEVSLTGEVAGDYIKLRTDQARLDILDAQEKSQRAILDLVAARARAGFVTQLDVNQQKQLLAATVAARPALQADAAAQRNAIAVLLSREPGSLDAELAAKAPVPPVPPRLPVGLPADLLRDRPDVRAAERQLAQATAEVGVATAELYPKFDLLGAISFSGNNPGDLFSAANLGEIGLGAIAWPLFHGGQIHATIAAREEERMQAYYAWQKTVLGAIRDAEDALVRYGSEQRRQLALKDAAATARNSTMLALQQYRAGLAAYASVLQAETSQFSAEDQLVQSQSATTADLVAVFKALGGGWKKQATPTPERTG